MNNLKNYFASPVKVNVPSPSTGDKSSFNDIEQNISKSVQSIPPSPVVCSPRTTKTDGRKIIKNMEEVLNSVKKKHKHHKHKHHTHTHGGNKKERNDLTTRSTNATTDPEICDISNIMDTDEIKNKPAVPKLPTENGNVKIQEINVLKSLKSPSKENILTLTKGTKKSYPKRKSLKAPNIKSSPPPTETITSNSPDLKSPLKNGLTIREHFQPTPKKDCSSLQIDTECKTEDIITISGESDKVMTPNQEEHVPIERNSQSKKNAFEFMMNARNKSIGMNSPGRDGAKETVNCINKEETLKVKATRKLLLEEWADKKGASKRKLNDVARDEYIEQEMNRRAKRIKKMVTNGVDNTSKPPIANSVLNDLNKKPKLSKAALKRIRRKSSIETDISLDIQPKEDIEFIAKLSSPTKKRDSLLGYFPKTISPKSEQDDLQIQSTVQKKKRKVAKKTNNIAIESPAIITAKVDDDKDDNILNVTPVSTRPRRSCAGNIRYDLIVSPIKSEVRATKTTSKRKSIKPIENTSINENDVIILDNSLDNDSFSARKSSDNIKLAPLFVKAISVPKPNIDVKLLAARQAFLMSGVPDKMKKDMEKQKQTAEQYEIELELFPKISHVPLCLNTTSVDIIDWKKCGIKWKPEDLNETVPIVLKTKLKSKQLSGKLGNITDCTLKDFKHPKLNTILPLEILPQVQNKRNLVKSWKVLYDKFPTYKCYNQLREKYRYFNAMDAALHTQQIAESFVVTKRAHRNQPKLSQNENDDEKPPLLAPNGELLFTDKYKPMTSEQVLVNLTPVNALKEFLSAWQSNAPQSQLNNSLDNFDYGNDSNDSLCSTTSNSIVLLGPNSSGKTQAVFALADELNFNVLEINAGMKRTGKKLLQELQEATQSHQVRKDSKKALLKRSLTGNKKQPNIVENSTEPNKMSLILVEDADILFEQHDAGFIDAIYQLSSISKRPVVIISNNPNCQHLMKLIRQNSVVFAPPNVLNISKFLSILSLIENCPIDLGDITSLYLYNNKDLRRTILEMQFFIQSGGDRRNNRDIKKKSNIKTEQQKCFASPTKRRLSIESSKQNDECGVREDDNNISENDVFYMHNQLFELFTNSQNMNYRIPFPVDLNILWCNLTDIFTISTNLLETKQKSPRRKSKSPKKPYSNNNRPIVDGIKQLDTLVEFYENISIASCLTPAIIENRLVRNIEEEISHALIEGAVTTTLAALPKSYNYFDELPNQRVNILPCLQTTIQCSNRSKFLDYEPNLRAICRSEKTRSLLDRRGSRFYHYLRGNTIFSNTFSTEFFENTCTILTDENTESEEVLQGDVKLN